MVNMAKRVTLSFDEECERFFEKTANRMSKVTITSKAGQRYDARVDRSPPASRADEVKSKFRTTTRQVVGEQQVDRIVDAVDNLEAIGNVSELVELLRIPSPRI